MPTTQPASTVALYMRRARYFRTMALTASTADLAITLVRLAIHYERLAAESAPGAASADGGNVEQPVATRPRQHRSTNRPG
jgi:hypothetical protein